MFRKKHTKKNKTRSNLLLMLALTQMLGPETMLLVLLALAMHRTYEYRKAINFPQTTPEESKGRHAILDDEMLDHKHACGLNPLTYLNNEEKYSVFFGRKPGFEDIFKSLNIQQSPISHSAIVIKTENHNQYLVVGRQSPCDSIDKPSFMASLMKHGFQTTACNEKYYGLFKGAAFQIGQHGVTFTGVEIINAVRIAEEAICKEQACTMVTSNCYSFSIYVLTALMVALDKRAQQGENICLQNFIILSNELRKAATDHLGVGVINNKTVLQALEKARSIADKHLNKPPKEKPVLTQHKRT